MALTPRQQRFVDEYLIDLNATQAAIRAGYSKNGAEVTASKLLRVAKVSAEVNRLMAKRAEKLEITAAGISAELQSIAVEARELKHAPGLSVARQALMDVAKLNGLIVETHESVTRSPEERAARLAELRAERERLARTH